MRIYWWLTAYKAGRGALGICLAQADATRHPERAQRAEIAMSDSFPPSFRRSLVQRLRSWFFTGLVVFGPIAVTATIAGWVIGTIDNWVRPWLPNNLSPDAYLPFHVPGLSVVIALVGLTLLGFLTRNFVGRSLVRFGEAMVDRTLLVRGAHKGLKQVFETIFSQSGSQFRKVGLVEFPVPGSWSLVFISSALAEIIASALPERKPMISCFMPCTPNPTTFMPCTPNPTTGYFFYIPADQVIELSISADEAAKLIMSAGLIQPRGQAAMAAMAEAAKLAKPPEETHASSAAT
jgi:uncharacterized membrane protein